MSLYEVLKASKTERFPDYWTLLWGRKLSASMIKTITGVLPLTFTAKGGTAVDWVIEGNDDAGENLINVADFTVGVAETHNVFSGILPAGTYTAAVYQNTALTSAERNTLVILKTSGAIYESANTNYHLAAGWHYLTFTIAESENVSLRYWTVNASNSVSCTSVMLVKGSTAPDHYTPYQRGVGERTENLFDGSTIQKGRIDNGSAGHASDTSQAEFSNSVISFTTTASYRGVYFDLTPIDNIFTVYVGNLSNTDTYVYLDYYDADKNYMMRTTLSSWSAFPYTRVITPYNNASYVRLSIQKKTSGSVTCTNVMLTKGPTAPTTYIPYGYQIPLTISKQGQPDKTVDIYIGDSPLTEGETVSKTSTGVDIATAVGENTVSTTLYNKPEMEIKYK